MIRQYRKIRKVVRRAKGNFVQNLCSRFAFLEKLRLLHRKQINYKARHIGSVNEKLVAFISDEGSGCSGMPFAVYEYMQEHPQFEAYKFIWLFLEKAEWKFMNRNRNTRVFSIESKKGIQMLPKAHYVVTDSNLREFQKLRSQQVLIAEYGTGNMHAEDMEAWIRSFLREEPGSADGAVKAFLRSHPSLFGCLKQLNQLGYRVKGYQKNFRRSLKEMLKKVDLAVLKVNYTFTGFFRSRGINLDANAKELYQYKDKYKGRRCFLVGNGPSLTTTDLELIQNEITFGCNRVYQLFEKTSWRPTYFCMIDALIAKYSSQELSVNVNCPLFTNLNTRDLMEYRPEHLIFARNLGESVYRVTPNFEAYYVPSGATVMTFMLELAMYMGFEEIYLIGVDCTSSLAAGGHCTTQYVNAELLQKDIERIQKRLNDPTLTAEQVAAYYFDKSTAAYRTIAEYADTHGFHIYNATRGGMLEVFERRNLDKIL